MSAIEWNPNEWFRRYHEAEVTEEFKAWWVKCYGIAASYERTEAEQDEYWMRCGIAWMGWKAAKECEPNDR